jgi:hypothetical protein
MADLRDLVDTVAGGAAMCERLAAEQELCRPASSGHGRARALRRGERDMICPIPHEVLVRYWAGDVSDEESDAIEEHVFGCAMCFEASSRVAALGRAIAEAIPPVAIGRDIVFAEARGVRRTTSAPVSRPRPGCGRARTSCTVFPKWSRVTGLVAAALFIVTAVKSAFGDTIVATSAPLPSAGYPFLVLTFVGWIRTLLAPGESPAAPEDGESAGARATG